MNKFNVLFIASSRRRGVSFNLTRLAIALEEIGDRVVVVSEPGEEEEGLREELKRRGIKHYTLKGLDSISIKNTISAARTMGRIVDCDNVDVIHAQGMRQLIVASLASRVFCRKKNTSIVVSIHTTLHGSAYENVTLLIESFLLNICADLVMPVAKSVADNLVNFGAIPNKLIIVYNGIDVDLLDEITCGDDYSFVLPDELNDSSVIVLGYFARLHHVKGHKYLIKAISEVSKSFPNIKLILTSDGPLRDALESLSRALDIEQKVYDSVYGRKEICYESSHGVIACARKCTIKKR